MKRFKFIFAGLVTMFAVLLLTAGGGGGSGGGGKSGGSKINKIPPLPNICEVQDCTIILPLYLNVHNIPGRSSGYQNFMPFNNLLNGGQMVSSPSICQNRDQNYCLITVTATDCEGYGVNGVRTFLWDATTTSVMSIIV